MTLALVHQAALLICESEVEWHLISTHQYMVYRTGMMSKSFSLLFKSSKFITTHLGASSLLRFKRTVKNCLKVEGNFKVLN